MWNESGIKTCPCKQVQIRTWTANLVRRTMWETVYQAESPQLNIDPCGSFCPSKTREANNKHIYIIPPVSWCWCPKGSAGSVFLCFTCMQLCEFCVCVCVSLPAHHCRVMWLDPLLFIYNWNGTDWQIREKWMSEVSLCWTEPLKRGFDSGYVNIQRSIHGVHVLFLAHITINTCSF